MAHVGTGTAGKVLTARGVTTQAGFKEIGTLSGLTDHGVLLGQGADPFVATAAGATGQVLTGVTGGDPVWAAAAVGSVLTDNATPQFAVVGSTSTVDFGITNLALGSDLSAITVGTGNVALGFHALESVSSGAGNTAIGLETADSINSGSNNVAVGKQALATCTSSNQNVAVGNSALLALTTSTGSNTAVGYAALDSITTGTANTALGEAAGGDLTTSDSSNICIKNTGVSGDNNTIRIGTNGSGAGQQDTTFIAGITGVTVAASAPIAVDTNGQISSLGFGTAAQVLTSNGAGTSPSWQAAGGGLLTATVTLTSAEVKACLATPITLLAAQGAGTVIVPVSLTGQMNYGGTNAFSNGQNILVSFTGVTTFMISTANLLNSSQVVATDTRVSFHSSFIQQSSSASISNVAMVIRNGGATEITGNAANDNTITVTMKYYVLTL